MDLSHVTPIHLPLLSSWRAQRTLLPQTNKTENQPGEGVPASLDSSLTPVLCREDMIVDTSLTSVEMMISWSG